MKKKILIIITIVVVPVLILLADHFILQENIQVDASSHHGALWDSIIENKSEIPSSLLQLATRNSETIPFVANYINEHNKEHSMNIQNELKDNQVPLLLQWDERWGYKNYGNDLMAINGCGPTCLSMVVSYLKQDAKYNPYYIAKYALDMGYSTGEGTAWTLMSEGARHFGVQAQETTLSEENIRTQLDAGRLIICSMRPGIFTTTGHFIVLREYKDGLIYVNDPNSKEKSQKGYTYQEIQSQIKNLWVYSL